MGEYDTRPKRNLSTLLQMLDARGKTILEAWHTDVDGTSFGQQEQNETGSFSDKQPFKRFNKRRFIGRSNSNAQTWPTISSVSFDKYHADGRPIEPRTLEEMWYSENKVNFNTQPSDAVQRETLVDSLRNVFGGDVIEEQDYKIRFLSALDGSFANVPSPAQIRKQSEEGFNAGQIQPFFQFSEQVSGGIATFQRYIFGDKRELDFAEGRVARGLKRIAGWEQNLMNLRPGANRINIVFNIRTNLDRLLQQNLLMPSDIFHGSGTQQQLSLEKAIEEGEVSNINDDTFTKLYLKNRSVLHAEDSGDAFNRNPAGTIGGRPVADLQGPEYDKNSDFSPNDNFTVFSFEEDFKRANPYTQDRGFIDNVAGNIFFDDKRSIGSLLPAVENDEDTSATQDKTTFLKSIGKADQQAFPFMFETVNKGGASLMGREYKQYCYLQATLQSLSESYAPSWSSKHFFGRTEQIHTYTMTDRTLDLSFVVFATEIRRLQNLYERITWLAQQTYASYDDSAKMKAGPLIRMTIGDMFSNLTGFIRSLSFDWSYLGPGGKWEITQGLRIPMACTVQMNFTIVHDDMPDRNYGFYPGPLLHPLGLKGQRGKLTSQTKGGPLIPTSTPKDITLNREEGMMRARMTPEERTEFMEERRRISEQTGDLLNRQSFRGESYISQIDNNKSTGIDNIY